jgi:hypothetical protein
MSPDGEFVTEGEFTSIQKAWERAEDMGSRWFFYPVCFVTGKKKIIDAPEELKSFIGCNLLTISKIFKFNSKRICDWINGHAPLILAEIEMK